MTKLKRVPALKLPARNKYRYFTADVTFQRQLEVLPMPDMTGYLHCDPSGSWTTVTVFTACQIAVVRRDRFLYDNSDHKNKKPTLLFHYYISPDWKLFAGFGLNRGDNGTNFWRNRFFFVDPLGYVDPVGGSNITAYDASTITVSSDALALVQSTVSMTVLGLPQNTHFSTPAVL